MLLDHPFASALNHLLDAEPWARERLATYKVPSCVRFLSDLPHNAMGKVVKPDVARLFMNEHA